MRILNLVDLLGERTFMSKTSATSPLHKNIFPLSEDDIIINDILKDRDQKEWPNRNKEINSKTLKLLKKSLKNRTKSSAIEWMDVGCGDGRCIELLQIFRRYHQLDRLDKINYLGIDLSKENIDKAQIIAEEVKCNAKFLKLDAKDIQYCSRFDVISAILFVHEVNPIYLPRILWNMLDALNDDGCLLISDFNDPYEQENEIVIWNRREIIYIIERIGGLVERFELIKSEDIPNLYFYNLCVKKTELSKKKFREFLMDYYKILNDKLRALMNENLELDMRLKDKMRSIIGRDIPAKRLTAGERDLIKNSLLDEDILAHRRKTLNHDQVSTLFYSIKQLENWYESRRKIEANREKDFPIFPESYRESLDELGYEI
jgi:SAM-dependent methyltransferase